MKIEYLAESVSEIECHTTEREDKKKLSNPRCL